MLRIRNRVRAMNGTWGPMMLLLLLLLRIRDRVRAMNRTWGPVVLLALLRIRDRAMKMLKTMARIMMRWMPRICMPMKKERCSACVTLSRWLDILVTRTSPNI
jgi:hypothetical protein